MGWRLYEYKVILGLFLSLLLNGSLIVGGFNQLSDMPEDTRNEQNGDERSTVLRIGSLLRITQDEYESKEDNNFENDLLMSDIETDLLTFETDLMTEDSVLFNDSVQKKRKVEFTCLECGEYLSFPDPYSQHTTDNHYINKILFTPINDEEKNEPKLTNSIPVKVVQVKAPVRVPSIPVQVTYVASQRKRDQYNFQGSDLDIQQHNDIMNQSMDQGFSNIGAYNCKYCYSSFNTAVDCNTHISQKHKKSKIEFDSSDDSEDVASDFDPTQTKRKNKSNVRYFCKICRVGVATRTGLKIHESRVHKPTH